MYTHALWREAAHYGPVRCIAAACGRVWTCGGSSAFAVFKEWTQSGIRVKAHKVRDTGESERGAEPELSLSFLGAVPTEWG